MKISIQKKNKWLPVLLFSFLVSFIACNEDEAPGPEENEEFEEFYTGLKEWYYWNDLIPDIDPSSYSSLPEILEAVRYRELDRWSFVTEWDEFWAFLNNSEFIGYGFGHTYDSDGNLRVTYVFNSTDFYEAGVRRSWIIKAINGTPIFSGANIGSLLGAEQVGITNTFTFQKPDGQEMTLTADKESIIMNTVLHYEVLEMDEQKIGYMVLQSFNATTEQELNDVFAFFAQQEIDDLILDLRYNGGGLTSVAQQLASLIGGEQVADLPFTKYSFNSLRSAEYDRVENFTVEVNSLSLNRLVTIATEATASASELVINGLRPYMDVKIVGADTYGKPMGANVMRFNDVWALVPITFKTKNADDEGDYFDGLPVDIPANDGLDKMFGDPEEESLKQALAYLLTGVTKGSPVVKTNPWPVVNEKDFKKNMIWLEK
jgi:C-terminal processing protease CtpA/Prc